MIVHRTGDMFNSKAELLVNPVNCKGVMGAGLAKQFKERFPENYRVYRNACLDGGKRITPGKCLQSGRVLNVFTKDHWKDKSEIEWIESIAINISKRLVCTSIAIPPIGCGLGGLNKNEVLLILLRELEKYIASSDTIIELWNFK